METGDITTGQIIAAMLGIVATVVGGLVYAIKSLGKRTAKNGNGNGGTSRRRIDELEEKLWTAELKGVEDRLMDAVSTLEKAQQEDHASLMAIRDSVKVMQGAFANFHSLIETWNENRLPSPPRGDTSLEIIPDDPTQP